MESDALKEEQAARRELYASSQRRAEQHEKWLKVKQLALQHKRQALQQSIKQLVSQQSGGPGDHGR